MNNLNIKAPEADCGVSKAGQLALIYSHSHGFRTVKKRPDEFPKKLPSFVL